MLVEGPVEVELEDGTTVSSDRFRVALCTCRRSRRYPWCDTSHRRSAKKTTGRAGTAETGTRSTSEDGTGSQSDDSPGASSPGGPPEPNSCARTRIEGGRTVVEVSGEVDIATSGLLAVHLDAATAGQGVDVLVDLRSVEFFDCSGLRVLCRAEARAREGGGRLRVACHAPLVRRLFAATGLGERLLPLPALPGGDA